VAKRSVKKARQHQPQGAARPETAAVGSPSRRLFWLGVLVAAVVLIPLAAVGVVIAAGNGDTKANPAAADQAALKKSIESEAATLRKQTQVRDKAQVAELTDRMRATVDALVPVLDGFRKALPPGKKAVGPLATPAAVGKWRAAVRKENEYFAETVSGETGTNVARGGFAAALDALNEATETYALAVDDPGHRGPLLARARAERDLAVRTWSVAATQLDAINIATGYGHQHVYLGGSELVGGFSADPAPEGSGAEGGG
jgi:hypothetical protein